MLQDMVHKPIAMSVIVPVTVAGILILSVLAAISSTNQAFAQTKPTTISSLGIYPNTQTPDQKISISGFLKSEGSGVNGATITVTLGNAETHPTTHEDGSFGTQMKVPSSVGGHAVKAAFGGDSKHEPSSATTTVTVY